MELYEWQILKLTRIGVLKKSTRTGTAASVNDKTSNTVVSAQTQFVSAYTFLMSFISIPLFYIHIIAP